MTEETAQPKRLSHLLRRRPRSSPAKCSISMSKQGIARSCLEASYTKAVVSIFEPREWDSTQELAKTSLKPAIEWPSSILRGCLRLSSFPYCTRQAPHIKLAISFCWYSLETTVVCNSNRLPNWKKSNLLQSASQQPIQWHITGGKWMEMVSLPRLATSDFLMPSQVAWGAFGTEESP